MHVTTAAANPFMEQVCHSPEIGISKHSSYLLANTLFLPLLSGCCTSFVGGVGVGIIVLSAAEHSLSLILSNLNSNTSLP